MLPRLAYPRPHSHRMPVHVLARKHARALTPQLARFKLPALLTWLSGRDVGAHSPCLPARRCFSASRSACAHHGCAGVCEQVCRGDQTGLQGCADSLRSWNTPDAGHGAGVEGPGPGWRCTSRGICSSQWVQHPSGA